MHTSNHLIHVSCLETKIFICKMKSACSAVANMHYKVCTCSQYFWEVLVDSQPWCADPSSFVWHEAEK
jgi:hypothetical protein